MSDRHEHEHGLRLLDGYQHPASQGFRVTKVIGVASGLAARTRGIGGKFVAGLQSLAGGE